MQEEMQQASNSQPILGVFSEEGLPYYVDRNSDENLKEVIPTLAEMAEKAIDRMKGHKNGFVLQIESGKVDWAAHANDIAGLIHDQIAFDEAVKVREFDCEFDPMVVPTQIQDLESADGVDDQYFEACYARKLRKVFEEARTVKTKGNT